MSRSDGPILFLDSGVGGLTVLAAVRALLPQAPIAYCADTAGFPYGTRSEPEVSARVAGLLGRLSERLQPSLIVIACNTASTIALDWVRPVIAAPIVGTVPAIKPAAERTRTGVIGVLGTEATVRQPYVDRLVADHARGCLVLRHGSAALVGLAEAKLRGEVPSRSVIAAALAGLTGQPHAARMDRVVLACTHFPLLEPELRLVAPGLAFDHGAEGIARRVVHLLGGHTPAPAPPRFLATGPASALASLAPALKSHGFEAIEPVGAP
ncbi:MAG: glutamate racemase [Sphingomonadaceae bacterium]